MLKIGDIVRFLNDVGGGRVVGFKGKYTVLVEDADGFEIPVPLSECVAVGNEDSFSATKQEVSFEAPVETSNGDLVNLSLAFSQNKLSGENADFQVWAINECNYSVFFNYLTKDEQGRYYSRFSGVLQPYSREKLFTFGHKFLNEVNKRFIVRALPFKAIKKFELKPVYEVELSLDAAVLFKANSFKENHKLDVPAYVMEVVSENELKYFNVEDKINELSAKELKLIARKQGDLASSREAKATKLDLNAIEEVDLHAAELLETTAGMGAFDILSYQIKVFKEHMDRYYGKFHGKRLVFIHGKGEGVLRQEILKELKRSYPKAKSQDASFREYGFGATMIFV